MKKISSLFAIVIIASICTSASATPLPPSGKNPKSSRWPVNSVINVRIFKDPDGKGRDALAKAGVERWTSELQKRGLTLNVYIEGEVPPGTVPNVDYRWGNIPGESNIGQAGPYTSGATKEALANRPSYTQKRLNCSI